MVGTLNLAGGVHSSWSPILHSYRQDLARLAAFLQQESDAHRPWAPEPDLVLRGTSKPLLPFSANSTNTDGIVFTMDRRTIALLKSPNLPTIKRTHLIGQYCHLAYVQVRGKIGAASHHIA